MGPYGNAWKRLSQKALLAAEFRVCVVSCFLNMFRNLFFLKKEKKKSLSAERSLGCGACRAVGTYYSFTSVPQAVDYSFLGTGAVSQP